MSYSRLITPEESTIRYVTVPVRLLMTWTGSKVETESCVRFLSKIEVLARAGFYFFLHYRSYHELIYQLYPTCILDNWFDALVSSIYTAQYQIDKQRTLIENKIFLLCMQARLVLHDRNTSHRCSRSSARGMLSFAQNELECVFLRSLG